MSTKKKAIIAATLLIVLGVVGFLLFQLGSGLNKANLGSEIALPILAIAGVITLLATLTLTAIAFAMVDLSDKTQALALPEGSVRAVIALALVVVFAIIVVYLYGSLASGIGDGDVKRLVVSVATANDMVSKAASPGSDMEVLSVVPSATNAIATVQYRNRLSRDASEFAKQLLILIGTLVTSVSSFYFGSRAVQDVASSPTSPVITAVSPQVLSTATNPAQLTILGRDFDLARDIKLVQGTAKAVEGTITQVTSGTIIGSFKLDSTMIGDWEVVVGTNDGRNARFPVKIL